jgi:outer membrane protein OmpA-like peptidoglycan-associated protein/outer membrane protein W
MDGETVPLAKHNKDQSRMMSRQVVLAATALAVPYPASAQPVTGLYVGAGAGVNITQQEQVKKLSFPTLGILVGGATQSSNLRSSTGIATSVSLGWGFGNGLRAEIEGSYRNNHIGGFTGSGATGLGGGTTEQKYGAMVNVLYDFNGLALGIAPYVGLGAGYAWINERFHAFNSGAIGTGVAAVAPGALSIAGISTTGSFAYQAILGAAFPLPRIMPGLAATAEYKSLGTAGNRSYGGTASLGRAAVPASLTLGPSYNHAILVGLRYNFSVAPQPPMTAPAAVPAQAPARSYLVFFDWDKATLTDRARQIIKEAADNSTRVQYTRIEVNGYTDTSGTPRYNQGLSMRRAQAVAAELVRDGVPGNAITAQGFGDTHLLVPTGPGVREPQNRRVEIIIR